MVLDIATEALRLRSADTLRSGLARVVREASADSRDYMTALAPLHDCARRLGLDVEAVFEEAARAGRGEAARIAREFGRRRDVTPKAFGFTLEDAPDGPGYRWI